MPPIKICVAVSIAALLLVSGCSRDDSHNAAAVTSAASGPHDFMAIANRPNQVSLIDLAERKIVRTCEIPGKYGSGTLQMAPDKHTAYLISNQFENLYGVNLDTCEITFDGEDLSGEPILSKKAVFGISYVDTP